MKIRVFLLVCMLIAVFTNYAANIKTINTYSKVMDKEIPAVVMTPESYTPQKSYPVIYLLHGHSGSAERDWGNPAHGVGELADQYNIIFIMPDGGHNSWYFDSPFDEKYQYETYIIQELLPLIDKEYSTIPDRKARGISGLSMGGHGALYLAFLHQDLFGVAGSMSGGVDLRPFPNNWEINQKLGSYAEYPENWEKNTVINMIHLLKPNSLSIIFDCGTEDFFYRVNCELHEKLAYMNIPHEFISRPGRHDWDYWKNAIKYQVLYMNNYFN